MFHFIRLAAAVAAAWIFPCLALAQGGPDNGSGKTYALVSDTELILLEEDLDLSWMSGPSEEPSPQLLQMESQPTFGSLDPDVSAGEPAWKYRPDVGFFGRDSFTYRVGDQTFQAYLLVVPAKFPIAGRWPTAGCRLDKTEAEGACPMSTSPGHGSELGWYDALEQAFYLCDWQGRVVTECAKLIVPSSDSLQAWTPLVLDRDGDGWHELALRDPQSGLTKVYTIVPNGAGDQAASLALVDQWWVGEAGDWPVAGSWLEGASSELGVYRYQDDVAGVFGHLVLESDSERIVNDVGEHVERAWPLVGDWLAKGKDWVGIFDLETRIFWHKPALGGAVSSISARDRGDDVAIPISVKLGAFRHEVVFGLFDPTKDYGRFHFFRVNGESYEDPLPLEVVVDPTGGPWVPPS